MPLQSTTVLRVFPGGEQCEVEVPTWPGIDGNTYPEPGATWNDEFDALSGRHVGHGAEAGFVITVRPGTGP